MRSDISFTVHLFKEGDVFVAHVPELNVSSCADSADVARVNIKEAVALFLQTAEERGTLNEILEESGYRFEQEHWVAPEFVSIDRMSVRLSA